MDLKSKQISKLVKNKKRFGLVKSQTKNTRFYHHHHSGTLNDPSESEKLLFDAQKLTSSGKRMLNEPNAGGSSEISE
eukprot:Pgem_evm1s17743